MALSTSNNVNEAAAALAAAQALIEKYNLESILDRIESDEKPGEFDPEDRVGKHADLYLYSFKKQNPAWKYMVAWAIAKLNIPCAGALQISWVDWTEMNKARVFCIGRRSNCSHSQIMFQYIERELEKICKKRIKETFTVKYCARIKLMGYSVAGKKRSWRHSFYMGAANAISERLRSEREKLNEAKRSEVAKRKLSSQKRQAALDIIQQQQNEASDWMIENNLSYSQKGRSVTIRSSGGYSHGQAAGNSIRLNSKNKALKGNV